MYENSEKKFLQTKIELLVKNAENFDKNSSDFIELFRQKLFNVSGQN